jgi:Membrane protein involved in the export of O-antigen and teichoic acid
MGIVIRQSLKTVAVTYLGIALGFVNTLWLYPYVLSEEQIGLSRTLINAAFLFATFASLGSANIPNRFFPYFKDKQNKHNGFLFFLLLLGFFGYLLFLAVFLSLKPLIFSVYNDSAPLLVGYYYYLVPFTAIVLFWSILESYAIIQQMPVVPSFVREVLIRGLIGMGLIALLLRWINFHGFVNLVVFSYGVLLLVIVLYLRSQHVLFLAPRPSVFRSSHLRGMLVYGGFVLMGNASGAVIANIDGLMLSAYSGLRSTGIYTIAFFIANIVEIPRRSLSQVLIPLVTEANKNNDFAMIKDLYKKSSINQLIVGGLLFIGIWCNIDNVFRLIPHGEVYVQGKWVVFWIGLSKLFDMATGINAEIIGSSKYYKYDLFFYVFLCILGVITNMIFIPLYKLTGAAFASAISIFLFNTMRFSLIAVKYKMQPFALSTFTVILLGVGIIACSAIVPSVWHPLVDIAVRSIVIAIVFIGVVLLTRVSVDINIVARKSMERARKIFQGMV